MTIMSISIIPALNVKTIIGITIGAAEYGLKTVPNMITSSTMSANNVILGTGSAERAAEKQSHSAKSTIHMITNVKSVIHSTGPTATDADN